MFVRTAVLIIGMGAVGADAVDVAWYDEGEDLFARPQGPRLQDGWLRHLPVPRGQEHQEVHHLPLREEERHQTSALQASPGKVTGLRVEAGLGRQRCRKSVFQTFN